MNWTKFNIGLSVVTIVVMGFFVLAPAHASWDNGPQAPIGGNDDGWGYSQEMTDADEGMSGDDHEPENEGGW